MQLTLTPGKIILFTVIVGIIEIIKFIIFIWYGSTLSKTSRYTKHSALKMNQLNKLISDQQIILRNILNNIKSDDSEAPVKEEKTVKAKKSASKAKDESKPKEEAGKELAEADK